MDYVLIGKIINTHGIKGELKVEIHTDFIEDRFKNGSIVYVGNQYEKLVVDSYRLHQGYLLVTFKELNDINLVLKYKDMNLYKSIDDIKPLKEGEYYFKDLKDLDVYIDDKLIGKVLCVESGPKYNFLRILIEKEEKLVPYLDVFVKNVDLKTKRIDIINMEGLL